MALKYLLIFYATASHDIYFIQIPSSKVYWSERVHNEVYPWSIPWSIHRKIIFSRSIDNIFKISRKKSPISIFLSLILKFKEQDCIIYKISLFAIFRYIYMRESFLNAKKNKKEDSIELKPWPHDEEAKEDSSCFLLHQTA